jgi:hypothetical protein
VLLPPTDLSVRENKFPIELCPEPAVAAWRGGAAVVRGPPVCTACTQMCESAPTIHISTVHIAVIPCGWFGLRLVLYGECVRSLHPIPVDRVVFVRRDGCVVVGVVVDMAGRVQCSRMRWRHRADLTCMDKHCWVMITECARMTPTHIRIYFVTSTRYLSTLLTYKFYRFSRLSGTFAFSLGTLTACRWWAAEQGQLCVCV